MCWEMPFETLFGLGRNSELPECRLLIILKPVSLRIVIWGVGISDRELINKTSNSTVSEEACLPDSIPSNSICVVVWLITKTNPKKTGGGQTWCLFWHIAQQWHCAAAAFKQVWQAGVCIMQLAYAAAHQPSQTRPDGNYQVCKHRAKMLRHASKECTLGKAL